MGTAANFGSQRRGSLKENGVSYGPMDTKIKKEKKGFVDSRGKGKVRRSHTQSKVLLTTA